MSKIFLMISAVLLLGTAALGFLNKSKLSAKTEEIKKANTIATEAQSKLGKAQSTQKDAEKKLSEATAKATELQTQMAGFDAEKKSLSDKIAEADKAIAAKDVEINTWRTKAGEKPLDTHTPPPGEGDLAAKLREAETQRDEYKTLKDGLEDQRKSLEGQLSKAQGELKRIADRTLRPGLRGQVLAVDRNWNFVVLSLGNRNGMVAGADMVVQRGGSLVGRIRITSVEPSQSIADIVPNSVPPGVSVQAGDAVIYPGER